MSQPRKHHYLPQFYIRFFSENGKQVFQIEKASARCYLCSIKDAAAIRDYHKIDHQDAEDPHILEKRLSKIEDDFAKALEEVITSGIRTKHVYARLIEFVSLMRVRVPPFKLFAEETLKKFVSSTGKIMERKAMLPSLPGGVADDLFENGSIIVEISNWKCMELMFEHAFDQSTLRLLASMTPSILRTPKNSTLITCDQPASVFQPDANSSNSFMIGLAHPKTEITLPLSHNVLLMLTWNKEAPSERIMTEDDVQEFNRRTIVMANSLVFSSKRSLNLENIVKKYNKYNAGFALEELDSGEEIYIICKYSPVMDIDRYKKV